MGAGKLSIRSAWVWGWGAFRGDMAFYVGLDLILAAVYAAGGVLGRISHGPGLFLSVLYSLGVGFPLRVGLGRLTLKAVDGDGPAYADLLHGYRCFGLSILDGILYGLRVLLGTILLVVPGIIWALGYGFYGYRLAESVPATRHSLRESAQVTHGSRGRIFLLALAVLGANLLGILCLGIGLLASFPVSMLALAHAYRQLAPKADGAAALSHPAD